MTASTTSRRARWAGRKAHTLTALGLASLFFAWWLIALGQPTYSLPGPDDAAVALVHIMTTGKFWAALALTFARAALGFAVTTVVGIAWGWLSGVVEPIEYLSRGLLQLLMSVPAVVLVILGMLWFGTNATVVVFVVGLVGVPVIATSTAEAVRAIDADLVEMGHLFGLSRIRMLRMIIGPSVVPAILATVTVVMGQSIRVAVMAELLATGSGLGAAIRLAQINIQTDYVFAYAIVLVLLTYLLDTLVIQPIQRRAVLYRSQ